MNEEHGIDCPVALQLKAQSRLTPYLICAREVNFWPLLHASDSLSPRGHISFV